MAGCLGSEQDASYGDPKKISSKKWKNAIPCFPPKPEIPNMRHDKFVKACRYYGWRVLNLIGLRRLDCFRGGRELNSEIKRRLKTQPQNTSDDLMLFKEFVMGINNIFKAVQYIDQQPINQSDFIFPGSQHK